MHGKIFFEVDATQNVPDVAIPQGGSDALVHASVLQRLCPNSIWYTDWIQNVLDAQFHNKEINLLFKAIFQCEYTTNSTQLRISMWYGIGTQLQ